MAQAWCDAGLSEENLKLAREGVARWGRGDVDAMLELTTSDFEFVPAIAATVEGSSVRGPEEFRRFFAGLDETWESFRIEPEEFREIGDQVFVVNRLRAKGRGSGVELDQPMFTVCWFRDGKWARLQSFLEEDAAVDAASKEVVK